MASWDDLDTAFSLPGYLPEDSEWRVLFEQMRHRIQGELAHMDLLTHEVLLVERFLTNYVLMRYREELTIGDQEGFLTAAMAKDVNAHWLSIASQVASLIEKGRERAGRDMVSKKAMGKIIADTLSANQDMSEIQKRELMKQLAAEFDRVGV